VKEPVKGSEKTRNIANGRHSAFAYLAGSSCSIVLLETGFCDLLNVFYNGSVLCINRSCGLVRFASLTTRLIAPLLADT
jgi:hypothetical protein